MGGRDEGFATVEDLFAALTQSYGQLTGQVIARFAAVLGLLVAALLMPGAAGQAALCLTVVVSLSLVWTIVEAVACQWFMRLVMYRHVVYPRDPVDGPMRG